MPPRAEGGDKLKPLCRPERNKHGPDPFPLVTPVGPNHLPPAPAAALRLFGQPAAKARSSTFEVKFTDMTTLPTFSDDPEGVAVRIAGTVLFVSGVGWLPWPASAEHARRLIQNSIVIRHSAVVLLVDRSPSWEGPKALPLPGRPARAPPPTIPRPDEPPA